MKKIVLLLFVSYVLTLKAQNYTFTKSTGSYSNLSASTIVANGNWTTIENGIKIPFAFKYWGVDIIDSIYIDDYGTISLDNNYEGQIAFLYDDLRSRGRFLSPVSYRTERSSPNSIFKIEYQNVGFNNDVALKDSVNMQCWLYETSNIIEFRYGSNLVMPSTWAAGGPFVAIANSAFTKFMFLENNPANPTINTTDINNPLTLNGMPANGTIYTFTPTGGTGVDKVAVKMNIVQNKISMSGSVEVKSIKIYNANGQIVQSVSSADETDLSNLNHGLYVVLVETGDGLLTDKLVL